MSSSPPDAAGQPATTARPVYNARIQAAHDAALRAMQGQTPTRAEPASHADAVRAGLRMLAVVVVALLAAHVLAGCGGAGDDPDVATPSVNCVGGVCR